jgi:hypothetical protein
MEIEQNQEIIIEWKLDDGYIFKQKLPLNIIKKHQNFYDLFDSNGIPENNIFEYDIKLYLIPINYDNFKLKKLWKLAMKYYLYRNESNSIKFENIDNDYKSSVLIILSCFIRQGGNLESEKWINDQWLKLNIFEAVNIKNIMIWIHCFDKDDFVIDYLLKTNLKPSFNDISSFFNERFRYLYEDFFWKKVNNDNRKDIIEKWQLYFEKRFLLTLLIKVPDEIYKIGKKKTSLSKILLNEEIYCNLKLLSIQKLEKVIYEPTKLVPFLDCPMKSYNISDSIFYNLNEYKERLNILLKNSRIPDYCIDWNKMTLAGGSALYLGCKTVLQKVPRDLDFFVLFDPDNEHVEYKKILENMIESIISECSKNNEHCIIIQDNNVITLVNCVTEMQIQWIFTNNISEYRVISNFDLDCVQCYCNADGWFCTLDCLLSLQSMTIRKLNIKTTPLRYVKYLKKGFSFLALPIHYVQRLHNLSKNELPFNYIISFDRNKKKNYNLELSFKNSFNTFLGDFRTLDFISCSLWIFNENQIDYFLSIEDNLFKAFPTLFEKTNIKLQEINEKDEEFINKKTKYEKISYFHLCLKYLFSFEKDSVKNRVDFWESKNFQNLSISEILTNLKNIYGTANIQIILNQDSKNKIGINLPKDIFNGKFSAYKNENMDQILNKKLEIDIEKLELMELESYFDYNSKTRNIHMLDIEKSLKNYEINSKKFKSSSLIELKYLKTTPNLKLSFYYFLDRVEAKVYGKTLMIKDENLTKVFNNSIQFLYKKLGIEYKNNKHKFLLVKYSQMFNIETKEITDKHTNDLLIYISGIFYIDFIAIYKIANTSHYSSKLHSKNDISFTYIK